MEGIIVGFVLFVAFIIYVVIVMAREGAEVYEHIHKTRIEMHKFNEEWKNEILNNKLRKQK